MSTRRRKPLPTTCAYCGVRERPRFQRMCPACSRRWRVIPTADELTAATWAEYHIGRQLDPLTSATLQAAVARLRQRKQLTLQERLELGTLLWGYGEALDACGLEVPGCDSLYRKLMGHDRRPLCRSTLYRRPHTI